MSLVSEGLGWLGKEAKHIVTGDPIPPDPQTLPSNTPMTTALQNSTGLPGSSPSGIPSSLPGSASLPVAGSSSLASGLPAGFSQQQASQIQNAVQANPDLEGVIQTLGGWGSDAWTWITQALPKNGDGSVNWGAVGGDIAGFITKNASSLLKAGLDVASVINQSQRSAKSDAYAQQAKQELTDQWNANAPLRAAGQAGMLNPGANTPNLSSLGAQGQQGQGLQASLPVANGQQAAGLANLHQLAGPGSGNPFAKALPVMGGPSSTPGMPSSAPSSTPSGPGSGALPVAGPPSVSLPNVISTTSPSKPGQPGTSAGSTASSPYGTVNNNANTLPVYTGPPVVTNAVTQAKKDLGNGNYDARGVTPNDTNPSTLPFYGLKLPIASA